MSSLWKRRPAGNDPAVKILVSLNAVYMDHKKAHAIALTDKREVKTFTSIGRKYGTPFNRCWIPFELG